MTYRLTGFPLALAFIQVIFGVDYHREFNARKVFLAKLAQEKEVRYHLNFVL